MKKGFLLLVALLGLVSCSDKQQSLKIVCPTNAPSLCFYNYANNENFITSSNPQNGIIPMFMKDTYDVIVAPTQGGLNQIVNQHANYQIAAVITFGNFFIVSTGRDEDHTLNAGDKVLIFQENDLPGKIFNYVYGDLGLSTYAVASLALTKTVIENNGTLTDETTIEFDYIFTSEPVVTSTNSEVFKNVQEDFSKKTNGKMLTQASVFVKKSSNKNLIDSFLAKLENSILIALENPDVLEIALSTLGSPEAQQGKYGVTGKIAKTVTEKNNGFSLGYKSAYSIKNDIQQFVDLFPGLKLGTLNEEVFYK